MNAETFMANFGHLADAPGGVAKLRQMVLQLAVQGKLVEQDPSDEPASELVERMRREFDDDRFKKKSIKSGIGHADQPFEVPGNWIWLAFGDFLDIQGGGQPPKSKFIDSPRDGYVRLFQIRDFGEKPIPTYVPRESVARFCSLKDVMLARYGASVGKVFMGQDGAYNVALTKIIFSHTHFSNRFIYFLLKSHIFQKHLVDSSRSAQAGFNKGNLHPIPIPLPPLAEQKRIVAKVDELMTLCDQLESQQADRNTVHLRLGEAALARLTTAEDDRSLADAWSRVRGNFDLLYSVPENVSQLRQAILQLAVQGKLVEQDPDDEPASNAAVRSEHKQRWIATANGKKYSEPFSPNPGTLTTTPTNWCLVTAEEIADPIKMISYGILKPGPFVADGVPMFRIVDLKNGVVSILNVHRVSQELSDQYARTLLSGGELLISLVGTLGLCAVVPPEFAGCNIHRNLGVIKPGPFIEASYLLLCFNSAVVQLQIDEFTKGGNQPLFNLGDLKQLTIPLPPLAEQKRIVAKVDELMTLCDQLEAQLTQQQTDADRLSEAMVAAMLNHSAA